MRDTPVHFFDVIANVIGLTVAQVSVEPAVVRVIVQQYINEAWLIVSKTISDDVAECCT